MCPKKLQHYVNDGRRFLEKVFMGLDYVTCSISTQTTMGA
jgi:hypothetical protein